MTKVAQIIELHKQGVPNKDICAAVGCTYSHLGSAVSKARKKGLLPPAVSLKNNLDAIYDMIRSGKSYQVIADAFKCKKYTVATLINDEKARNEVPADVLEMIARGKRVFRGSVADLAIKAGQPGYAATFRELWNRETYATLRKIRTPKPKLIITDEIRQQIINLRYNSRYNAQAIVEETGAEIEDVMGIIRDEDMERMLAA